MTHAMRVSDSRNSRMTLIVGDRRTGKTVLLCEKIVEAVRRDGGRGMIVVRDFMWVAHVESLLKERGWLQEVHVDIWEKATMWNGWHPTAIGLDEPPNGYINRVQHLPGPVNVITMPTPGPLAVVEIPKSEDS